MIRKNPFSINPIPIEEVLKNPTKYLNKEVVFGLVTVIDNNLNDKTLYVSNINIQDNCKGKRTSFIGSEILLNYKNLKKTNIAPNDIKGMSYYVLYVKGRVLLLDKNKSIIELSDIHATGKYQTDDSNIYIPIE